MGTWGMGRSRMGSWEMSGGALPVRRTRSLVPPRSADHRAHHCQNTRPRVVSGAVLVVKALGTGSRSGQFVVVRGTGDRAARCRCAAEDAGAGSREVSGHRSGPSSASRHLRLLRRRRAPVMTRAAPSRQWSGFRDGPTRFPARHGKPLLGDVEHGPVRRDQPRKTSNREEPRGTRVRCGKWNCLLGRRDRDVVHCRCRGIYSGRTLWTVLEPGCASRPGTVRTSSRSAGPCSV